MGRRNFSISWRRAVFGVIAVTGAVFVAIGLRPPAGEPEGRWVRILTAKVVVPAFSPIRKEDLGWVAFPPDSVPTGAYLSVKDLFGEDEHGRRFALRTFEPGEPIVASKVAGNSGGSPAPGGQEQSAGTMRPTDPRQEVQISITAEIDPVAVFAAGDLVDIVLVRVMGDRQVSAIIMRSIVVVTADPVVRAPSGESRRTFTLALTALDAHKLVFAQQFGNLIVSLRGSGPPESGSAPDLGAPPSRPDWFQVPPEPEDRVRDFIQTDFPIPPDMFPGWEPPTPSRTTAENDSPERP